MYPSEYIQEVTKLDGFSKALQELKENLNDITKNLTIKPVPKLLFLGTGSCIPNKTRNTSGILLQIRYDKHNFFACLFLTFLLQQNQLHPFGLW